MRAHLESKVTGLFRCWGQLGAWGWLGAGASVEAESVGAYLEARVIGASPV